MRERALIDRRRLLLGSAGAALTLCGCDRVAQNDTTKHVLAIAEKVTSRVQRLISPPQVLAREYAEADLSPYFKPNGTSDPDDDDYQDAAGKGFADWQLEVGGLVERPAKFSLADLRALPSRTQITRHDCVEGWSCIGKWKGVPLSHVLAQVRPLPNARFVLFRCFDSMSDP